MSFVNPIKEIKKAQAKGYAVPAFNIHNLETIQAVVNGAVEQKSPVMIAATPGTLKHAGIKNIVSLVKNAAEDNDIPIALHVDHCIDYDVIASCIECGFTSVMIDASHLPYEENIALTKKVVELAHKASVCVEAELGKIGGVEDDIEVSEKDAAYTVPDEALDFVKRTKIDTLAIAIGTAHGLYKGKPELDFVRLKEIAEIIDIPLVLHGASGVDAEDVRKAISLGICKVNIATELKIPFADAIKEVFKNKPSENDPRNYMGAGRAATQKTVEKKIEMCKSANKAQSK